MNLLVRSWIDSIAYFLPSKLFIFLKKSLHVFGLSMAILIRSFWIAFVILAIEIYCFLEPYTHALEHSSKETIDALIEQSLMIIILPFTYFILTIIGIIAIWRNIDRVNVTHYSDFFFRICVLIMSMYTCVSLIWLLLFLLGIEVFPNIPPFFSLLFDMFQVSIVWYWLDSLGRFRDFVIALERGINVFFYNLPFFILFLLFVLTLSSLLGAGVFTLMGYHVGPFDFITKPKFLALLINQSSTTMYKFLVFIIYTYGRFIIDIFCLSCLYILFKDTKLMVYSRSVFRR